MTIIPVWPVGVLRPQSSSVNPVPFSRGNTTLGGQHVSTNTDAGFWSIKLENIPLRNRDRDQWRCWNAIRSILKGTPGRIAVPAMSSHSAPYVSGKWEASPEVPHDDDTLFDDDTPYVQGAISVVSVGVTDINAGTMKMRIINGYDDLSGVRFSYEHALYETGRILSEEDGVWEVEITPPVRAVIPAGADLEFDEPTCLCCLEVDSGMDLANALVGKSVLATVNFIEDTDYWNRLALGLEV
ncbi:hypothetical protein [Neorhizobium sp. NCHU2750]|uniref:hypothetical protein n=1 Tax=Neorhizobium sp. NCHU2750 TaxID=1825976 RepID=UPI000E7565E8|nr:hypothetical protein NCHU2750_06330 [Neorhizobium sp. NCHU2750]